MAGHFDSAGSSDPGNVNPGTASGSAAAENGPTISPMPESVDATPDLAAPVHTLATYRILTRRGLAPDEAANLTAFLVGLGVHRSAWTIDQVNRMLFLRELYRGDWGDEERSH